MNEALAKIIIENDKNDYRFEQFAQEICGKAQNVHYLPTSQSWDRGRDGRTAGPSRGSHRNILCATLNRDVDAKVEADLLRVTATSTPDHLAYCSSQYLSEEKADEIDKLIRRHLGKGSLSIYGSLQLARLSEDEDYAQVFEKHYHAEIASIRASLEAQPNENEERRGLRLAIVTVGSIGAADLKEEVLSRAILEILADGSPRSLEEISETFSNDLGIPRPLRPEVLQPVVTRLQTRNLIEQIQKEFKITEPGTALLEAIPTVATDFLLKGRIAIREKIELLTGGKLSDKQFEQIWSSLLDFISALFYEQGLEVLHALDGFLSGVISESSGQEIRNLFRTGAHKVATFVASTPERIEVIETAIKDLFVEREGPAFEWLLATCERFVSLCCLGLESQSAAEIKKTLVSNSVVIDSDIVLTYLSEHSPEYAATRDLLGRWRQLKGKILLAPVVLEEVAYHAWISDTDFGETRNLLGKVSGVDIRRYLRNAFVREFHWVGAKESHWPKFIGQYRGNSPGDYTKIRNLLALRLSAGILPDSYDEKLAEAVTAYLVKHVATQGDFEVSDLDEDLRYKLVRDGRLLASIAAARSSNESLGTNGQIIVLSSSSALRRAEQKFRGELHADPPITLTRAAFAYLLAMIPEAQLGTDSLRRALFEFGSTGRLRDSERRALRIIRATEAYDIAWAERPLLRAELNKSVQAEANRLGTSPEQVRRTFATGEDPETSSRVIANALRNIAKHPEDQEKLKTAERRIRELEDELAEARSLLKKAPSSRNSDS